MKKTTTIKIQTKNSGEGTRIDSSTGTIEGTAPAIVTAKETPEEKTTETGTETKAESKPKAEKVFPICKCGCGESTRGGIFRPGHDAKYYSAIGGHTPKAKSSGNHLVDTVMGLYRKMDVESRNAVAAAIIAHEEALRPITA